MTDICERLSKKGQFRVLVWCFIKLLLDLGCVFTDLLNKSKTCCLILIFPCHDFNRFGRID